MGNTYTIFGLPLWVAFLIWIAIVMWLFYFIKKTDEKGRKKVADMQQSVRKGDKVATAGGIIGTVISRNSDDIVTLLVDENTGSTLHVYLQSIQRILSQNVMDDNG